MTNHNDPLRVDVLSFKQEKDRAAHTERWKSKRGTSRILLAFSRGETQYEKNNTMPAPGRQVCIPNEKIYSSRTFFIINLSFMVDGGAFLIPRLGWQRTAGSLISKAGRRRKPVNGPAGCACCRSAGINTFQQILAPAAKIPRAFSSNLRRHPRLAAREFIANKCRWLNKAVKLCIPVILCLLPRARQLAFLGCAPLLAIGA